MTGLDKDLSGVELGSFTGPHGESEIDMATNMETVGASHLFRLLAYYRGFDRCHVFRDRFYISAP